MDVLILSVIPSYRNFASLWLSIINYVLLEQVKRLLDEGMDVNVAAWGPKSKGITPLHLAAEGGHLEVMDELLERGADIDARTWGACGCKYHFFFCKNLFLDGILSETFFISFEAMITILFHYCKKCLFSIPCKRFASIQPLIYMA